jgi:hypothetical protein
MSHGPCAGARADWSCEVPGAGRCSYLDVPDRDWPYAGALTPAPGDGPPTPEAARSRPRSPAAASFLARLLAKIDAGADVVFVDHCGGAGPLADAVAALRAAGFGGLVLGCVPVVTSASDAKVVASFAGDRMPPGYLDAIMSAPCPAEEGVTAAVHFAEALLALPGVDGVNLSAGAGPGRELAVTRATAEVSRRVLGARSAGRVS